MKITTDQKEIVTSIVLGLIEAYKIWMACLLVVFVPQYCPDTKQTCTIQENFIDLNDYNKFVLAFNFFTLVLFKLTFYLQNKRELYIITHLDVDPSKGYDSLSENISNYLKIFQKITYYNNLCYKLILFTTVIFIINTILSTILLCFFYDGFRTLTTLIANILLVTAKLYKAYEITKQCIGEKILALSYFRESPISYNVIDPDYKIDIPIKL